MSDHPTKSSEELAALADGTISRGPRKAEQRRREEIEAGLTSVRDRITQACSAAGREPSDLTLVVVTKFFPASDVRLLAGLGVRDVGENRHQEAVTKAEECADLDVSWHFVGGLQSNKAAAVASYADVVHSLDRGKLVRKLSQGATERGRDLDVLLQVSLDPPGAAGRSGAEPDDVPELARLVVEAEGLRLRGVMGVAPLDGDPDEAFTQLAEIASGVRAVDADATWLSAGMSGDLEAAIRHGATHLRVGSAVLGPRPSFQ